MIRLLVVESTVVLRLFVRQLGYRTVCTGNLSMTFIHPTRRAMGKNYTKVQEKVQ